MKKNRLFLLAALLLTLTTKAEKCSSLHEQLTDLNKYWNTVKDSEYLEQEYPLLSEKDLIQLHLFLVKDILHRKNKKLLPLQQNRRNNLLNKLEVYAQQGVFPKNQYHNSRTPYFIDDAGTACAVGNLIIQSGQEALSLSIAEQYNYNYIEDMPQQNISSWANAYGFTIDELKWIQPSYNPACSPGQVIQPNCRGFGCFNPNWQADGLIAPVNYFSEYNDSTGWVIDSNNTWRYGARVGQHRITVTDSINQSKVYEYTMHPFLNIPIRVTVVDQSPAIYCNGKITIEDDSSGMIYHYRLTSQEHNYSKFSLSNVFDSLCIGTYDLFLSDGHSCHKSKRVIVSFSTGIEKSNLAQSISFQNPFQRYLKLNINLPGNKVIRLYSMEGKLVYQRTLNSNEPIDLETLKNGLYVAQIEYKGSIHNSKIIKSN